MYWAPTRARGDSAGEIAALTDLVMAAPMPSAIRGYRLCPLHAAGAIWFFSWKKGDNSLCCAYYLRLLLRSCSVVVLGDSSVSIGGLQAAGFHERCSIDRKHDRPAAAVH